MLFHKYIESFKNCIVYQLPIINLQAAQLLCATLFSVPAVHIHSADCRISGLKSPNCLWKVHFSVCYLLFEPLLEPKLIEEEKSPIESMKSGFDQDPWVPYIIFRLSLLEHSQFLSVTIPSVADARTPLGPPMFWHSIPSTFMLDGTTSLATWYQWLSSYWSTPSK